MHPIFKPLHSRDLFWPIACLFVALTAFIPLGSVAAASFLKAPVIVFLGLLHIVSLHTIPASADGPADGFARALGLSFFAVIGDFSVTLFAISNSAANAPESSGCGMIGILLVFVPAASWLAHFTYGLVVAAGLWILKRWSGFSRSKS